MDRVHAEIDDTYRKDHGQSVQDAINAQTLAEQCQDSIVPGYHNAALRKLNANIEERNGKQTGKGTVHSFEEFRDKLLSSGFSAEDADRLAREEMDRPTEQQEHTSDEFSDAKFKRFKVMKSAGASDEEIRTRMKQVGFTDDVIARFLAHTTQ